MSDGPPEETPAPEAPTERLDAPTERLDAPAEPLAAAPAAAVATRDPYRTDEKLHGGRRWAVRILLVTATVLGIVGVFAIWADRQVLNADNWANTSSELLQDKAIKSQLSGYIVDQIYANVNVAGELESALPKQLKPLAGPAAGGLEGVVQDGVNALLGRPLVQQAWKESNRVSMQTFINVVEEKKGTYLGAQSGAVVLDVRPIVVGAIKRVGLPSSLIGSIPPDAGQIKVISSPQIKNVQSIGQALQGLALLLGILVPALFALAVFLARGRRRRTLLAVGVNLVVIGVVVLIARIIAGRQVVDSLATTEAVRPAVEATWSIGTHMLRDIARASIILAIPIIFAALLAGPAHWAVSARRWMAPLLREQPGLSYAGLGVLLVLVIAWGPIPATQQVVPVLVMIGLSVLGLEVLRRQTAAEFPDAHGGNYAEAAKRGGASLADAAKRGGSALSGAVGGAVAARRAGGKDDTVERLEALASLRDRGVITDEEFAAQKARILGG